jgi:hypothetical protein
MEAQQDTVIVALVVVVLMCLTVFLGRALGPASGLLALIS